MRSPTPREIPRGVPHPRGVTGESRRAQVVVIEDDEDCRVLLGELLEDAFDVTLAADAGAGLDALAQAQLDVVVTDESLPGLRGTELAREAKRRWPHLRAVLVSGYSKLPGTEACDIILHKPLEFGTLPRAIASLVTG